MGLPRRILAAIVLVTLLSAVLVAPALAAITLASFTATPGNTSVRIDWETASEINMAGFYVRRSAQVDGTYNRISDFIPSQGDPLSGGLYNYSDAGLTNGTRYYYKLEAVNTDSTFELHGPIDSMPLNPAAATQAPTATATQTQQAAITATYTATQAVSAATATRTPVPSATATLQFGFTATRSQTPVASQTPTITIAAVTNTVQPTALSGTPAAPTLVNNATRPVSVTQTPDLTQTAVFERILHPTPVDDELFGKILGIAGIVVGLLVVGLVLAVVVVQLRRKKKPE